MYVGAVGVPCSAHRLPLNLVCGNLFLGQFVLFQSHPVLQLLLLLYLPGYCHWSGSVHVAAAFSTSTISDFQPKREFCFDRKWQCNPHSTYDFAFLDRSRHHLELGPQEPWSGIGQFISCHCHVAPGGHSESCKCCQFCQPSFSHFR